MNIKGISKEIRSIYNYSFKSSWRLFDVSEKTRERVKNFANKYQYRPNPYASTLATGKTKKQ